MSNEQQTILVVDDNQVARMACSTLLADLGYRVLQAPSAESALGQVSDLDGPLTLVLADVSLPDGPVETLVRLLRKTNPAVPVLYLSGHDNREPMVQRALAEPATFFLQKPVLFDALQGRIKDILAEAEAPRAG